MDDALNLHLEELESLIQRAKEDGNIDVAERAELAALVERVRDDLAAGEEHGQLVDQLESGAIRFEADHPTIATIIRGAIHTLTGYGM